jgi:hypothetical protein
MEEKMKECQGTAKTSIVAKEETTWKVDFTVKLAPPSGNQP